MGKYSVEYLDALHAKHLGRCSYGGRTVHRGHHGVRGATGWELEHGTPIAAGGRDDGRNHRVACWACNRLKGPNDAKWWKYRIDNYYGGKCPEWRAGEPVKRH